MCVHISKVLDKHEVDDEVDREHPPVEGVEKPGDLLLLAVSDQELDQAGVHTDHGQHEAEVGQGPDPQVTCSLIFSTLDSWLVSSLCLAMCCRGVSALNMVASNGQALA